jgi:hypothetical protein
MDNTWNFIGDKMKSVDKGLLRIQDKIGKKSFNVNNIQSDHPTAVSIVIHEEEDLGRLINHTASLTQESPEGYLYITGLISGMEKDNVLLMTVYKASWFVRKGKGKDCWLEEACVYDQVGKAS